MIKASIPPPSYAKEQEEGNLDRIADASRYNQWLVDRAAPYLGRRILDFGAGLGTVTELIAGRCESLVAVEPDVNYRSQLRARFAQAAGVEVVASLDEAGAQRRFDTVICLNVLEHVPEDALVVSALGECLADGGYLLVLVPAHPFLYGPNDSSVGHERRYRRSELERLVGSLQVVDLRHVNPVGAIGWGVAGRVFRRTDIPHQPLRVFDRFVPAFRALDWLRLPFGLSLWLVAQRKDAPGPSRR